MVMPSPSNLLEIEQYVTSFAPEYFIQTGSVFSKHNAPMKNKTYIIESCLSFDALLVSIYRQVWWSLFRDEMFRANFLILLHTNNVESGNIPQTIPTFAVSIAQSCIQEAFSQSADPKWQVITSLRSRCQGCGWSPYNWQLRKWTLCVFTGSWRGQDAIYNPTDAARYGKHQATNEVIN